MPRNRVSATSSSGQNHIQEAFLAQSTLIPAVNTAEQNISPRPRSPSPPASTSIVSTEYRSSLETLRSIGSQFASVLGTGFIASHSVNQAAIPYQPDTAPWMGNTISANAICTIRDARLKSDANKKYDTMPGSPEAKDAAFAADHHLDMAAIYVNPQVEDGLKALVDAVDAARTKNIANFHMCKNTTRVISSVAVGSSMKSAERHADDMRKLDKQQQRFTTLKRHLEELQAKKPLYDHEFLERRQLLADWFASLPE